MPDNNPEYYIARAAKARRLADAATDEAIRAIHEEMAVSYDGLAKSSEEITLRQAGD